MLIRSRSPNLPTPSPILGGLFCLGVSALTLVTACAVQMPDAAPDVPTIARQVKCIELTKPGLSDDSINGSLVDLAVADAKRHGSSIKLYKVVPGSEGNYYVFSIGGWDDIYTVYQTGPQGSQFVGKYQYGSFHYPCSAAADAPQPSQGTADPGSTKRVNQ